MLLKYENDVYSDLKKDLPKVGSVIDSNSGKGKVISVDILKKSFILELDDKSRVEVKDYDSKK